MSWNDPELLKEVAQIESTLVAAVDSATEANYEQLMADLRKVAVSTAVQPATCARILLAVMPTVREYERQMELRNADRAGDLLLGLIDAIGNLVANIVRASAPGMGNEITGRVNSVLNANLAMWRKG